MKTPDFFRSGGKAAFTLIELMVSMTLIVAVMVLMLNTVDSTQKIWKRTATKATQFQSARSAFEAMTRRLSQATLNTYWRAYDPDLQNTTAEYQFRRHSELEFLSGPTSRIFTSPALSGLNPEPTLSYPTHSVFFQAPLGHTEYLDTNGLPEFRELDSMLTGCGYFIEFGDDPNVPDFIRDTGFPARHRFRLMELSVPSERISIHQRFNDKVGNIEPQILDANRNPYIGLVSSAGNAENSWLRPFWMEEALRRDVRRNVSYFKYGRVLAENIVALVILPKQARKDRRIPEEIGGLAPEYSYDSWRILHEDRGRGLANVARDNLLPPIVQVMVVAMDEVSASRKFSTDTEPPDWTDGLFERVRKRQDYMNDVDSLEQRLRDDPAKINYRIFSADVVIRGSKWSQNL